jgi:hypothetical protein
LRACYAAAHEIDLYTKSVLTVIAVPLVAITCHQYMRPEAAVYAQSAEFSRLQFAREDSNLFFFDTHTGEIWEYYLPASGVRQYVGDLASHSTLTKLGQPIKAPDFPAARVK